MPKFFPLFLRSLGILAVVFFIGAIGFSVWMVFNANWLPEHLVPAVLQKVLITMGDFFPALYLSALAITFSYTVKSADFFKNGKGGVDTSKNLNSFFYIAIAGALVVLVFQFVLGPVVNQSLKNFQYQYRMVTDLEAKLRVAHEVEEKRFSNRFIEFQAAMNRLEGVRNSIKLEMKNMETATQEKGVFISPKQRQKWVIDLQNVDHEILELNRKKPIKSLDADWQSNILISYDTEDSESLSFEEQLEINKKILFYRPGDKRAREAAGLLQKAILSEKSYEALHLKDMTMQMSHVSFSNPLDLLEESEVSLGRLEYYKANQLAFLAYKFYHLPTLKNSPINPELESRALLVLKKSYEGVKGTSETLSDREEADFFRQMQTALGNYSAGNYVDAYYQLNQLKELKPRDPELLKFFHLSRQEIAKEVIFSGEAEDIFQLKGFGPLVFANPLPQEGVREIVSVESLVPSIRGAFLKDLEVMRWDSQGRIISQFTAPYGLLSNGILNMNFRDEKNSDITFFPQVEKGISEIPLTYPLAVTTQDLEYLGRKSEPVDYLSIYDLFNLKNSLKTLGYGTRLVETLVIVRFMESFLVFTLSFFLLAVSWFFRSKHLTQAPAGLSILSLMLPVVVLVFYKTFIWIFSLLIAFILTVFPFWFSLAGWIVVFVVLIIANIGILRKVLV